MMPRKPSGNALIPPSVARPPKGQGVNLWLREEDIKAIDAIKKKMGGTRSDAIRWMLSVVSGKSEKKSGLPT